MTVDVAPSKLTTIPVAFRFCEPMYAVIASAAASFAALIFASSAGAAAASCIVAFALPDTEQLFPCVLDEIE